jgi:hypothetical protein
MYEKSTLLLKNIQGCVQNSFVNERTPFYFLGTSFLFVAIVLSVMSALCSKENFSDFFPVEGEYYGTTIHDNTVVDKLCWFFSQITHHTILLLFFYFFLALVNRKSEQYFKMVAPLALTISVLYFYFLFPKQRLRLHQLSFSNFFSHFMIIFLVFGEFMYIKNYTFQETTHCFLFISTCLCAIFINYTLRGVWSYNLVKLDRYKGWDLVGKTTSVMFLFSFMFFYLKNRNNPDFGISPKELQRSVPVFSGLIGIVLFTIYTNSTS